MTMLRHCYVESYCYKDGTNLDVFNEWFKHGSVSTSVVDNQWQEHPTLARDVVEGIVEHALPADRQVHPTWKAVLGLVVAHC